jgi:hypothetical protein
MNCSSVVIARTTKNQLLSSVTDNGTELFSFTDNWSVTSVLPGLSRLGPNSITVNGVVDARDYLRGFYELSYAIIDGQIFVIYFNIYGGHTLLRTESSVIEYNFNMIDILTRILDNNHTFLNVVPNITPGSLNAFTAQFNTFDANMIPTSNQHVPLSIQSQTIYPVEVTTDISTQYISCTFAFRLTGNVAQIL